MKKLRRTINIRYEWWRNDGKPIPKKHIADLEEAAQETINQSMANGNREGQLLAYAEIGGVNYTGYWNVEFGV